VNSLKSRLGWGLVAALVVLFVLQAAIIHVSVGNLFRDLMAEQLEHNAEALLAAMSVGPDRSIVLLPSQVDPVFRRPLSGHYFRIEVPGAVLYSRSLWDEDFPVAPPGLYRAVGPEGRPLLIFTRRYIARGLPITISVTDDLAAVARRIRQMQVLAGALSLSFLALLVIVQRAILVHALRPLDRVHQDMAELERGEAARVTEEVPEEILPLVLAFNRLAGSMARRVERSRTSLGNLAHAIKTPLSLIRQATESPELAAATELRQHIEDQAGRIGTLVERELSRARLAGEATPGERLDLERELGALLRAVQAVHRERDIRIDMRIPAGRTFAIDREDFLELFGNLLDNACKWAVGRVRVTVEDGRGLVVAVEDDGPGCPPGELENIARRGVRLDEAAPGHGLGLSIAGDVAESYGGGLSFGRSPELGGFVARVVLPDPADRVHGNPMRGASGAAEAVRGET